MALSRVALVALLSGTALSQEVTSGLPNRPTPKVDYPAPPSALPPFVGSGTVGTDGYAPLTADRVALLSLLRARRFKDLDACFEAYQTAFEKDYHKEQWPEDAQDAFSTPDPRLDSLLDEWVSASPRSFGAAASRGGHRADLVWYYRTASPDARDRLRAEATADLQAALSMRPRLVSAYRTLVGMTPDRPAESRRHLDDAIRACPECYRVRRAFLQTLLPIWGGGGTLAALQAFTADVAALGTSPKLRIFPGFVPWFEGNDSSRNDPHQAIALYDKALSFGEHWEFVYRRGSAKAQLRDFPGARQDLDRAVELRPQVPELLVDRAHTLFQLGEPEPAGLDYLLALRLEPLKTDRRPLWMIVRTLVNESYRLGTAGRGLEAERLLSLAVQLDPDNPEVMKATGGATSQPPPPVLKGVRARGR